jgi:hypothetical protein
MHFTLKLEYINFSEYYFHNSDLDIIYWKESLSLFFIYAVSVSACFEPFISYIQDRKFMALTNPL